MKKALMTLIILVFGFSGTLWAAEPLTIGVSFQQLRDPFFISIVYGCQKAALEEGVKLLVHEAGGYPNVDRQIAQIEDFIQKKVNMIIIMPTNAKGVAPIVERAIAQGIPAMHMGSRVASDKMVAFVQSDDYELGASQSRYAAKQLGGKGNLIYIAGPAGVTWTVDRWNGYSEEAKKSPGLKVLQVHWIDSTREAALRVSEDSLQAYKNINSFGAGSDFMLQSAANAVEAAGLKGKIILTAAGLLKDTEDMIRGGLIQMTAAQQTVLIGYTAVKTAISYLRKTPYKDHTTIPPVIITKENIDKVSLATIQHPDSFRPKASYP
jgi:ABC-type sugar transport system substrate-binding protein